MVCPLQVRRQLPANTSLLPPLSLLLPYSFPIVDIKGILQHMAGYHTDSNLYTQIITFYDNYQNLRLIINKQSIFYTYFK